MRIRLLKISKWYNKSYPVGWKGTVISEVAKKLIKSGNAVSEEPVPPPLTPKQKKEIQERESNKENK